MGAAAIIFLPPCSQLQGKKETPTSSKFRITALIVSILTMLAGAGILLFTSGSGLGWGLVVSSAILLFPALCLKGVVDKRTPRTCDIPVIENRAIITSGQGEYLLFSKSGREITQETYNKAYLEMDNHSVAGFFDGRAKGTPPDRANTILKQIKKIDTDLSVAFIPRTLFELMVINLSIDKELQIKEPPQIIELAYKVNQFIANRLNLTAPLSYGKIKEALENEMTHFDGEGAQILRNAVALECSEKAKTHLFLYRGANFTDDKPYVGEQEAPNSLSYSTGLFSGFLHDGACTFHDMGSDDIDAFALALPMAQFPSSLFSLPLSSTLCQLLGSREASRAKSKFWYDARKAIRSSPLMAKVDQNTLISGWKGYQNMAVFLKS